MTKSEFDAIKARMLSCLQAPEGASMVMICMRDGQPIHPDELGAENAARFKRCCEATAKAVADRRALVEWIVSEFDVEWFDKEPDHAD